MLAINTLAPFILNSRLRRLLGASLTLNPDPYPIPDLLTLSPTLGLALTLTRLLEASLTLTPHPHPDQAARGLPRAAALRNQRERYGGQVLPLQDPQPPAHQHGKGRARGSNPRHPACNPTRRTCNATRRTCNPTRRTCTATYPRPRST